MIKTGKFSHLLCLTFQNLQTEVKYHDYCRTICILKRTRFLRIKCRKLGVSDDVIRKIVTSGEIFFRQNVSTIINSLYTKFHYYVPFVPMPEITLAKKPV